MIKWLGILSLMVFLQQPAWAQETVITDEATTYPFEGVVAYHIDYKQTGNVNTELPDSMELAIRGTSWSVDWFGGINDELQMQLIWSATDSLYTLVHHGEKTIYQMDRAYRAATPAVTKTKSEKEILEISSQLYKVTTGEITTEMWVAADTLELQGVSDTFPAPAPPFLVAGVRNLPLRMETETASGKTITQAMAVRKGSVAPEKFQVPEGYAIKTFDFFSQFPAIKE